VCVCVCVPCDMTTPLQRWFVIHRWDFLWSTYVLNLK